jgi:hypothetical protein
MAMETATGTGTAKPSADPPNVGPRFPLSPGGASPWKARLAENGAPTSRFDPSGVLQSDFRGVRENGPEIQGRGKQAFVGLPRTVSLPGGMTVKAGAAFPLPFLHTRQQR